MSEPLTARSVTIGETNFTFSKMLPLEGYRLFEEIRSGLGDVANSFALPGDVHEETVGVVVIGNLIGALPPELLARAQAALFRFVSFTNPNVPTAQVLAGQEEAAFMGLEPTHVYEVTIRAFAVNFSESYAALRSRVPAELRAAIPLFAPST